MNNCWLLHARNFQLLLNLLVVRRSYVVLFQRLGSAFRSNLATSSFASTFRCTFHNPPRLINDVFIRAFIPLTFIKIPLLNCNSIELTRITACDQV